MDEPEQKRCLLEKLAWFVGIWFASVLALGVVSLILRYFLNG